MSKLYDPLIEVCSRCLQASCWQGIFMCDDYMEAATVKRKVSTLLKKQYEHPDYWNNELNTANKLLLTPEILKRHGAPKEFQDLSEEPGHA